MDQLGKVSWSHTKQWRVHYAGELHELSLAVMIPKCDICECSLPQWAKSVLHHDKMFQGHMSSTSILARNVWAKSTRISASRGKNLWVKWRLYGYYFTILFAALFKGGPWNVQLSWLSSSLLEDRTLRLAFSAMATVTSTISGAIGLRPLSGSIPKSPVNSNLWIMFFNSGTESRSFCFYLMPRYSRRAAALLFLFW